MSDTPQSAVGVGPGEPAAPASRIEPVRDAVFTPLTPHDPHSVSRYLLRARIGEGGMGAVYLSYTPGGRPIALKVARPELAADPDFRSRFSKEVAIARRVQGPYTVPVIDADPEALRPWIATAYVAAPSLAVAVVRQGALPSATVLMLIAGVAEALQSIHRAGVIHRDLKPGNVILADDGPRVIDFGVARAIETSTAAMTQTGVRIGTPAFMSPEQVRGKQIDAAGDVFALGSTAYYALTGRPPFGSDAAVFHRIEHQQPDWDHCPDNVRAVLARCLAKDPAERPTSTQVIELCRSAITDDLYLQTGGGWLPPTVAAEVTRYRISTVPSPTASMSAVPPPTFQSAPTGAPDAMDALGTPFPSEPGDNVAAPHSASSYSSASITHIARAPHPPHAFNAGNSPRALNAARQPRALCAPRVPRAIGAASVAAGGAAGGAQALAGPPAGGSGGLSGPGSPGGAGGPGSRRGAGGPESSGAPGSPGAAGASDEPGRLDAAGAAAGYDTSGGLGTPAPSAEDGAGMPESVANGMNGAQAAFGSSAVRGALAAAGPSAPANAPAQPPDRSTPDGPAEPSAPAGPGTATGSPGTGSSGPAAPGEQATPRNAQDSQDSQNARDSGGERGAGGASGSAGSDGPRQAGDPASPSDSGDGDPSGARRRGRRRRRRLVTVVLALLVTVSAVFFWLASKPAGGEPVALVVTPSQEVGTDGPGSPEASPGAIRRESRTTPRAAEASPTATPTPTATPAPKPVTGETPRAAPAAPRVSPAPTQRLSCPAKPATRANGDGTGVLINASVLREGPADTCGAVVTLVRGRKFWLWCNVVTKTNDTWWWARLDGTEAYGWVRDDDMKVDYTDDDGDGKVLVYSCDGKVTKK
ncbi:serine/threonine protein kinase [Parafrankia sp. EAN1pec]|uniref:serine/threonine-protein kinase n=1 Tax=Parafrankia sp. (strain EAN1pec) TaxID=298653 RepID=UPI00005416E2|nr:serine/threonine protein kinase [Frankia sp. EAN1pec]